jgi:POTRA domain, FtsQ-type
MNRKDPTDPTDSRTYLQRASSPFLIVLLLVMFLIGTAIGGVFRVRNVNVVGTNLPVNLIVQTAGVRGQNLFTVQSDLVSRRLASVKEIAVQRVETSFPDRVTIYAVLRKPFVAFRAGRALYELDWKGSIIREVATTALPVIVGSKGTHNLGAGVVEAVRYAIDALKNVPNGPIASFRFDSKSGLQIIGQGGWMADVGYGPPQSLVNRVATLATLLSKIKGRSDHLRSMDLRLPLPYARFTGA